MNKRNVKLETGIWRNAFRNKIKVRKQIIRKYDFVSLFKKSRTKYLHDQTMDNSYMIRQYAG